MEAFKEVILQWNTFLKFEKFRWNFDTNTKPAFTEHFEFKYQTESKLEAVFENFGAAEFWGKDEIHCILVRNFSTQRKFFDLDNKERNPSSIYVKTRFR